MQGRTVALRRIALGVVLAAALPPALARAQSDTPAGLPPPPGMKLDEYAQMHFPQPVRVGTLIGRDVLRAVPSRALLGTVRSVVRDPHGNVLLVIDYGGPFGFGGRPIAVPIQAVSLVGTTVEVMAYSPAKLAHFPTFTARDTTEIPADAHIEVGLAKPSH